MRKLLINISDSETHECISTIICEHFDACKSHTNIYKYFIKGRPSLKTEVLEMLCIPKKINHWNVMDELITIYYEDNFEMEIRRIKND